MASDRRMNYFAPMESVQSESPLGDRGIYEVPSAAIPSFDLLRMDRVHLADRRSNRRQPAPPP